MGGSSRRKTARRSQRRRQSPPTGEGVPTHAKFEQDPLFDHGVKVVAIVSMVVDHVGMVFFPNENAFRLVGRLAMPLFAYLVAEGVHRTSHREAYLCRLLALFVCSQFPYGLFVGAKLNIFLPLFVGALATTYIIERRWIWATALMLGYGGFAYQHEISYGVTGPLLVLAFSATRSHLIASTALAAGIFLAHGELSGSRFSQMAAFMVPLVPVVVRFVHWNSTSKWRWAYWVYPAHLALFYMIAWQMGIIQYLRR